MRHSVYALVAACGVMAAGEPVNRDNGLSYAFTKTSRFEPKAWVAGKDRFPSAATIVVVIGGIRRTLVPGFFASADPAVFFDGDRVLFSGRRTASDRWQIWETKLAGGTPKLLTNGPGDCVKPLYIPENKIVYTRYRGSNSFLEIAAAGSQPVRLTYGPARVLADDVLQDGRIIFESAGTGARELFAVYPDGTGVESIRCDHGADRSDARQVASGDVVFSTGEGLAMFTAALAKQARLESGADTFGPVAEISAGRWIGVVHGSTGHFELWLLNASGRRSATLDSDPAADVVQPVVLSARVPPKRFPSALVPTRTAGNLLCMDVRTAKPALSSVAREVRFFTKTAGVETELGRAPIEKDGSFYVQVPANQPLRMELLESAGKIVRSEHGWFWMKPSEQRICVGCHAGPERAPENKVPQVLVRSTDPAKLMGTTRESK